MVPFPPCNHSTLSIRHPLRTSSPSPSSSPSCTFISPLPRHAPCPRPPICPCKRHQCPSIRASSPLRRPQPHTLPLSGIVSPNDPCLTFFEAASFDEFPYRSRASGESSVKPQSRWVSGKALVSVLSPTAEKVNMRKSISMQAGQSPNFPITHRIVQLIASLLILQLPLPAHALEQMYSIPKIELESNFQSVILADLDPVTAKTLIGITGPFLSGFGFLFILRIVMSWYPKLPVDKFPYVIAYAPTEPILRVTRKLITPVGGVDVTPVVWFGLLSFLNEILVGPQGLLVLLSQKV